MKKPNLTPLVYLFLLLIVINTAGCNGISKANIMSVDAAANSADTINTPAGAQKNAKAALTELFLELKTETTPAIVERIVNDIDEIVRVVRFDGWQNSTVGERDV